MKTSLNVTQDIADFNFINMIAVLLTLIAIGLLALFNGMNTSIRHINKKIDDHGKNM